jgi:uncharacterized protein YxjI
MAQPNEQYTIRRKVFQVFGASFHIYDEQGAIVGFCHQKAFRLRENLVLYTDESKSEPLLTLQARQVIDFGATFDVAVPGPAPGDPPVRVGSLRRRAFKSMLRDSWQILGPNQDPGAGNAVQPIATIQEDSAGMAAARRFLPFVAFLNPQSFHVVTDDGRRIATLRQHFNPWIYRLGVRIEQPDERVDDLLVLGAGCLIAAIEGRQDTG